MPTGPQNPPLRYLPTLADTCALAAATLSLEDSIFFLPGEGGSPSLVAPIVCIRTLLAVWPDSLNPTSCTKQYVEHPYVSDSRNFAHTNTTCSLDSQRTEKIYKKGCTFRNQVFSFDSLNRCHTLKIPIPPRTAKIDDLASKPQRPPSSATVWRLPCSTTGDSQQTLLKPRISEPLRIPAPFSPDASSPSPKADHI